MHKRGPIIVIEDDKDDKDILIDIFEELDCDNKVLFFSDGVPALEYLISTDTEPFLILSDINLPKLNGIDLREKINTNEELKVKCIPYLFFSTSAEQNHVIDAYSQSVQGFFVKPAKYADLKNTIKKIIEYWQECVSPDYVPNERQ